MTSDAHFIADPALELVRDIVMDAFARVREAVPRVVDGLTTEELLWRPDPGSNSAAWLLWHLSRIQDDHISELADEEQVWFEQGWVGRFDLPYDPEAVGFGQSAADVAAFRLADPQLLVGYQEAVYNVTAGVVRTLSVEDLHRVVDDRWDPPVTAAVRIVSVIGDITQHLGQAAYVRGLVERRRS